MAATSISSSNDHTGKWADDEGRTLKIRARSETKAEITLLLDGRPMLGPWCGNKPAEGLIATYSPRYGPDLDIDPGRPGFSLNMNYERGDSVASD